MASEKKKKNNKLVTLANILQINIPGHTYIPSLLAKAQTELRYQSTKSILKIL